MPSNQKVQIRPRPRVRMELLPLPFAQQRRDLAARIVHIAERERARRTSGNTCGTAIAAVQAERALVGVAVGVDVARVVWAGGDTGLAAGAEIGVDEHRPAVAVEARAGRAVRDARRVAALLATLPPDLHHQVRVRASRFLVDPTAEIGQRHAVLLLAGDDAGAAADAAAGVDGHGVAFLHGHASARSTRTKFTLMPVPPMIGSV